MSDNEFDVLFDHIFALFFCVALVLEICEAALDEELLCLHEVK